MPDHRMQGWAERAYAELGGRPPYRWQALPAEASRRRFYRLAASEARDPGTPPTLIVMHSPPELENNGQFQVLAELFARHGIGVPRIHRYEPVAGTFLLSDLGHAHLEDLYHSEGTAAPLKLALDTLVRLQQVVDPRIPPYTRERFRDELGLYDEWFLGGLLGIAGAPELADCVEVLLQNVDEQPTCCVHRDYHCRNLLRAPDGTLGVVDFQDALHGPAAYDPASLLRDCYYALPETDVARWRDHYLEHAPVALDPARFPRQLDLTALQRQLKAIGIFARLSLRDAKTSHLHHIVPLLERIRAVASGYADLQGLCRHIDATLPAARRRLASPT